MSKFKSMQVMSAMAMEKMKNAPKTYKDVMELAKQDKRSHTSVRKRDMPVMSMPKHIKINGVPHKFVNGELVSLKSK
jgi:hypothetical protein